MHHTEAVVQKIMNAMDRIKQEDGMTLIEIMVSMVISSFVIAGIYGVYTIQQRSYTVQEQVAEMQQRIRSALDFMIMDIRMAGYNEQNGTCSGSNILTADKDKFYFEYCDIDSSGNPYKETFKYELYDAHGDGIIDLGREKGGGKNAIAEGVDAIEFQYLDKDGNPITTPVAAGNLEDIRMVRISMLVQASYPDPRYTDTIQYVPASGIAWSSLKNNSGSNPPNDHYHRRLLITTVKLRNMGL